MLLLFRNCIFQSLGYSQVKYCSVLICIDLFFFVCFFCLFTCTFVFNWGSNAGRWLELLCPSWRICRIASHQRYFSVVHVWAFTRYSSFIPHTQNVSIQLIAFSKLQLHESSCWLSCLSLCNGLETLPGCVPPSHTMTAEIRHKLTAWKSS